MATDPAYATSWANPLAHWTAIFDALEARGVICEEGFEIEEPDLVLRWSNSQWTNFTCSPETSDHDYEGRYTKVVRIDGTVAWTISHRNFAWSKRNRAVLETYRWTADGKYLYLVPTIYLNTSGFPPSAYFMFRRSLYRLNLESGEFETILPEREDAHSFSLSPDDRYLTHAYPGEQKIVHILDWQNNGEERSVALQGDYVLTGAFAWKPDSSQLFFASGRQGWETDEAGISLFKLSLRNMHLQIILSNDRRQFIPFYNLYTGSYWLGEDILILKSIKYLSDAYWSEWAINVQTGAIILVSTPDPRFLSTSTPAL